MEKTRDMLFEAMGELPEARYPVTAKLLATEDRETYTLEHLLLDANGYEPIPAIYVSPKRGQAPYPAVLYNHSHGGHYHLGKSELLRGADYMPCGGYAKDLTDAGYAVLAIDQMCFEERGGYTETSAFKRLLWDGHAMWSWMVFDSLCALDYLANRPDVDETRVATLGMSMGSSMAQWVAALDTRVRACADICCLVNYDELVAENALDRHGVYYYVPGLRKRFTAAEINGLIAPRAHFSLIGQYDPLTPAPGVARDEIEIAARYEALEAADRWLLKRYPVGHLETRAMRADVLAFLAAQL